MTQQEIDQLKDDYYLEAGEFKAPKSVSAIQQYLDGFRLKTKQAELNRISFEKKRRFLLHLDQQIIQNLDPFLFLSENYFSTPDKVGISFFQEKLNLINLSASVKLSYLFSGENIKIRVSNQTHNHAEIIDLFQKLDINFDSYQATIQPFRFDIHFGSLVDFKDLYILVSLLKNYGLQSIFFSYECDNIICIGSSITQCDNKLNVNDGIEVCQFLNIPSTKITGEVISGYFSTNQSRLNTTLIPDDYPDDLYEVEDENLWWEDDDFEND